MLTQCHHSTILLMTILFGNLHGATEKSKLEGQLTCPSDRDDMGYHPYHIIDAVL